MQTHAVCVQTALVPQNTRAVHSVESLAPELVAQQAHALLDDVQVAAIKVGLVPSQEVVGGKRRDEDLGVVSISES